MTDQPRPDVISFSDLRTRVSWFFYGTRTFSDLDTDSQSNVDEIINDGYERFLVPHPIAGERKPHRWNFLRPIMNIATVADQSDYALPSNFGGLDGPLFYQSSDTRAWPIEKVDPAVLLLRRQRDYTTVVTSYPVEFAITPGLPSGTDQPANTLMLWPTPSQAFTLEARYFILAGSLTVDAPYPACDAYHNQALTECILSVAEERLDDAQGIHTANYERLLMAAVSHDRDKYAPDHLAVDRDVSDIRVGWRDGRMGGDYTTYNGYTPGS